MKNITDRYKIFKDAQLIIERVDGVLSLENLAYIKDLQDEDPDFDPTFNLLTDIRSTEIQFTPEELTIYAGFLEMHPVSSAGRRFALLTQTPKQVAIGTLIKNKTAHLKQQMEIFSTVESALRWLQAPISAQEVLDIYKTEFIA